MAYGGPEVPVVSVSDEHVSVGLRFAWEWIDAGCRRTRCELEQMLRHGIVAFVIIFLSAASTTVSLQAQPGVLAGIQARAEQGDAESQYVLGSMYAAGTVVEQDFAEAVQWFRLSAEQGFPQSYLPLAQAYRDGQGVTQDFLSAHVWFILAASAFGRVMRRGAAAEGRDEVETRMTSAQIAESQQIARRWVPGSDPFSEPEVPSVVEDVESPREVTTELVPQRGTETESGNEVPSSESDGKSNRVRGTVSINGLYQVSQTVFLSRIPFWFGGLSQELYSRYQIAHGPVIDVQGRVLLTDRVGLGCGVSRFVRSGIATTGITSGGPSLLNGDLFRDRAQL